jgi:hypothetical protein
MTESITLQMSPEEFRNIIRELFWEEVAKQPEKLYTASQAMDILGISDYRTFNALGITPRIRGKRKYYSLITETR